MSILDKPSLTQLQNGLNKDMSFQRPGDVTFALNGIRDSHDGGKYEYQSEPGNEYSQALPDGYVFVGSIYGQNNEIYIFSTNGTSSEIGLFKQDYYVTLANANLGFSTQHPITGEYKVRNGCERIIYWCDGFNPDRFFNIDVPDDFKTSSVFDPNKFKLVPDINCPHINLISVNDSGGSLPLGSYYFQLEIVDNNGNSIYKTDISPQTIIYNEDQSDAYNNIDGGLNIDQYSANIGGVPITNKSINLRFSNLDTSFKYLRVNVARQIAGTGNVDAHAVGALIPISASTLDWTYTGYNTSNGDYPLDYSEMLVDNVNYKSSYINEQVQGRLLRANLEQDTPDYSAYQSFASLITAEWVAKEIETANQFALGNPKNPNTYWDCTSFQGDEVYAFAIQYLHKNGVWSPAFHIPGRHSNATDLDTITVVANSTPLPLGFTEVWESDVEHLGYTVGQTLPRWKAFNTASITTSNTTTHPYDYIGEFGYYETDNMYPDIQDCNGEYIWGFDPLGNQINTSTKIRHFRFPDRRLIPHVDGTNGAYLVPFGVKFDNISYPSSDIVGHRFCHAIRSENNKTVVDSGWAVQPTKIVTGSGDRIYLDANFSDWNTVSTNGYVRYNSANIFFNKNILNPDYIRLNHAYHIESFPDSEETIVTKTGGTDTITAYSYLFLTTDKAVPTRTNHAIENQVFVPSKSYTPASIFGIPIQSDDFAGDDNIIRLKSLYLEDSSLLLDPEVRGGASVTDPVTGTLEYNNFYVYKKVNNSPYNDILNLNYRYINFNHAVLTDSNEFYNGDSIISLSSITRMFWPQFTPDNILQGLCYSTFYEEHQFNSYLRHSGTGESNKYYRPGSDISILLEKVADLQSDTTYQVKPYDQIYPEYFSLNKDYNIQSLGKANVSLPLFYDYCSDCINSFPNRIVFSPVSFDEETFDFYRINKANDYIDLPAHRGKIKGLKYQNNQLIVHCEDTTFILQPDPQRLATDLNTAYLTTGDFLGIPPQEILQTDTGTAGLQSKQSMCDTPFGHYWIDQKRGEIFGWNGQLEMLSNKGLLQWFKERLPSEATRIFYDVEKKDFPIQSTYDRLGVGIIMYYDPRFKRLIISKKDYQAIDQREEFLVDNPLIVVWSFSGNKWITKQGVRTVDSYPEDVTRFINRSWTISYSFTDQSFTSWHSYTPSGAFSDDTYFYTIQTPILIPDTVFTQNIWKHLHYTNYQNYYNTKYDFIVEWINNDLSTDTLSTIHYNGYALSWNHGDQTWVPVDSTFDRGLFYNFDQSTGLINLQLINQSANPYDNVIFSNVNKSVIKTDENYKISGLYDILTTNPPISSKWDYLKLYTGYIDIVPITANHNTTVSAYNLANIKNKFVICRLFYKPAQDYKKVITLLQTNELRSIR